MKQYFFLAAVWLLSVITIALESVRREYPSLSFRGGGNIRFSETAGGINDACSFKYAQEGGMDARPTLASPGTAPQYVRDLLRPMAIGAGPVVLIDAGRKRSIVLPSLPFIPCLEEYFSIGFFYRNIRIGDVAPVRLRPVQKTIAEMEIHLGRERQCRIVLSGWLGIPGDMQSASGLIIE